MAEGDQEMRLEVVYGHVELLPMTYRFVDHGDGTGEIISTWHSVRVAEDGARTPCDEDSPLRLISNDNAEAFRAAMMAGFRFDPPVRVLSSRQPPPPPSFLQRAKRWLGLTSHG